MKIKFYIYIQLVTFLMLFCTCGTRKQVFTNAVSDKYFTIDSSYSHNVFNDTSLFFSLTPNQPNFNVIHPQTIYNNAYSELQSMLENRKEASFKRAVFITENAYFDNVLDYNRFCNHITSLSSVARLWAKTNKLADYHFSDSTNTLMNAAIFYTLSDTVFNKEGSIVNYPYTYDFNDCFARENWTNMFVTKLLLTHKGNCHSLPFLYKIIAEELGVNAWLSFTPNHIYLRNWCKKTGWYNTELTNASFPNEGWLMASGYVSTKSIVSGIYMDTLGLKQSIVICLNDLAKGYLRKIENPDLKFVISCCDLGLKHFPNYAELLLLKAETHLKIFKQYETKRNNENNMHEEAAYHFNEMKRCYASLAQYDYREIPEEMFIEWMDNLKHNKEKYQNIEINRIFKSK